MAKKLMEEDKMGKNHGKYDMDRVGLFAEMPYMINEKYKPIDITKGTRDLKNSQMYPSILKTKTGLQDAYFDPKYKRLFENEKSKKSQIKLPIETSTKPPFVPSSYTKRHATPGDSYGTFGPVYKATSNLKKPTSKNTEKILANIFTIPTNTRGPGWADRGMSPFPVYMPSLYEKPTKMKTDKDNKEKSIPFINVAGPGKFFTKSPFFNKDDEPMYNFTYKDKFEGTPFLPSSSNKNRGNCFSSWPSHMVDPYKIKIKQDDVDNNALKNNIFYPQTRNKTFYTVSTIHKKLRSAHNNTNWRTLTPLTFK
ncbi:Protein of unknown function DUF4586 [Cinara cedri]|uniref:Cilia-and flagella-associated protein 96 n=1 Tax=Cinara cedri TaxID=506608 RepID=A0A5E4N3G5_9HEMI|nr:Protein of unknown function DUF4586 [Cinara cedri]